MQIAKNIKTNPKTLNVLIALLTVFVVWTSADCFSHSTSILQPFVAGILYTAVILGLLLRAEWSRVLISLVLGFIFFVWGVTFISSISISTISFWEKFLQFIIVVLSGAVISYFWNPKIRTLFNKGLSPEPLLKSASFSVSVLFLLMLVGGFFVMWKIFGTHRLTDSVRNETLARWIPNQKDLITDVYAAKRGGIDPTYVYRFRINNITSIITQAGLEKGQPDQCLNFARPLPGGDVPEWWRTEEFNASDCYSRYGVNGYILYLWFNPETKLAYFVAQNT